MRMVEFPCCDRLTPESLRQLLIAFLRAALRATSRESTSSHAENTVAAAPFRSPGQAIPLPQDRPEVPVRLIHFRNRGDPIDRTDHLRP